MTDHRAVSSGQRKLNTLASSAERRNRQGGESKNTMGPSTSPNQSMNALAPTFSPAQAGSDDVPLPGQGGGSLIGSKPKGSQGGISKHPDSTVEATGPRNEGATATPIDLKSDQSISDHLKIAEATSPAPHTVHQHQVRAAARSSSSSSHPESNGSQRASITSASRSNPAAQPTRQSGFHIGHRKSPSEMTPLIAEQLALQQQIELLQQQQTILQNQQQAMAGFTFASQSPQLGSGTSRSHRASSSGAHRRVGSLTTGIENQIQSNAAARGASGGNSHEDSANAQTAGTGLERDRTRSRNASTTLDFSATKGQGRRHSNIPEDAVVQGGEMGKFEFPPRSRNITGPPRSQATTSSGAPNFTARHRNTHSRGSSRNFDGDWRTSAGPQSAQPQYEELQQQAQQQAQLQQAQVLQDHMRALSFGGTPQTDQSAMMSASNTAALLQAQAQMQAQILGLGLPNYGMGLQPGLLPNMMPNTSMYGVNPVNTNQQGQQRKTLFTPYLPQGSIAGLLADNKLVKGALRINKKNRSDAYVSNDLLNADIFICGSKDRNRALEGDIVAIELLDVGEVWGAKKEKEEKKRRKEDQAVFESRSLGTSSRRVERKKGENDVEAANVNAGDEDDATEDQMPKYAGHVVAIIERSPGQLYSGQLGLLRPSSAATKEKHDAERRDQDGTESAPTSSRQADRPKIVWFKPTDKRVPLIAIPTEQAPSDFVDNEEKYATTLFVACIKRWPITSLHPFGNLVEEIGQIGDVEAETRAILKDNGFSDEPHDEAVNKCLPPVPWSIPEREYTIRRDLRGERVFSIDPPTAKDLDDAIHIKSLGDDLFEVGVHIADVTYFVKLNTALDREARKRATTVYLIQKAIPMLPGTLCEELCSLNPAVERLTFSVIWKMNKDAEIVEDPWFGKTIIKSRAKLAYGNAQDVIEGRSLDSDIEVVGATHRELEDDIRAFNRLAGIMRMRRFDGGALKMDSIKLSFSMDDDGEPIDCHVYHQRDANKLIEEFMLLANISVAHRISKAWPAEAFLRRHEKPIQNRMDAFKKRGSQLGYEFDIGSSRGMAESFAQVDNQSAVDVLKLLAIKPMHPAKYFCAGTIEEADWAHYALAVPMYTHFTSPIRRYADVVVHRQLEAAIANDSQTPMDADSVIKTAVTCNSRKEASRIAQEQSGHLFLCIMIHNLTVRFGPCIRPAIVFGILDAAFDVYVPDFGIEKRIHMNHLPVETSTFDEHEKTLSLYWKRGIDVVEFLATSKNDEQAKLVHEIAGSNKESLVVKAPNRAPRYVPELDEDESGAVEESDLHVTKTTAKQYAKSKNKKAVMSHFSPGQLIEKDGHAIQKIKEMTVVPVVIVTDISKSPALIRVFGINPYATN